MNGAVSGTFLVLAAIIACHLQSAAPTVALVVVPAVFVAGVGAAYLTPADAERQDRIGFVATLVLLFTILLWAIDGVFAPLLGRVWPAAGALAPLVPTVLLYLIARRLLAFDRRDWGLTARPGAGTSPIHATVALVAVVGASLLLAGVGGAGARPDPPAAAVWVAIAVAFEEILYRGFLLAALRERVGGTPAIAVQALLFTLAGGLSAVDAPALLARLGLALVAGGAAHHTGWVGGVWIARLAGLGIAWWVAGAR